MAVSHKKLRPTASLEPYRDVIIRLYLIDQKSSKEVHQILTDAPYNLSIEYVL